MDKITEVYEIEFCENVSDNKTFKYAYDKLFLNRDAAVKYAENSLKKYGENDENHWYHIHTHQVI